MSADDLDRRDGETPTAHMLRGIFAAIVQGLDEAGHPLSVEQLTFLDCASEQLAEVEA